MSFTEEEIKSIWTDSEGPNWILGDRQFIINLVKYTNALLVKNEGEPIVPKDIRVGDEIEVAWDVNRVRKASTGIVGYISDHGSIFTEQGGYIGHIEDDDTFYLINRPAPQLPTEAPAMIKATEVRGVKGEWWLSLETDRYWRSYEKIKGWGIHLPKDITKWKPVDFVVREEEPK